MVSVVYGSYININQSVQKQFIVYYGNVIGLGGLGVKCSPRDPRFAGSNPAEVDGFFFQGVKIMSTSPPGGTLSWGSRV